MLLLIAQSPVDLLLVVANLEAVGGGQKNLRYMTSEVSTKVKYRDAKYKTVPMVHFAFQTRDTSKSNVRSQSNTWVSLVGSCVPRPGVNCSPLL